MIINPQRLLADLHHLAGFGKCGSGVERLAFSDADISAREWLCAQLEDIGLDARMDGVGNVYGRFVQAPRAILIGSHSDTVPRGGWLDGALGVVYGLEIARAYREAGESSAIGIDVMSFEDEEGTFVPCLGSRSFCGALSEDDIASARAKDGRRLADVLRSERLPQARFRCDPVRHIGYFEAHIEQGPRLESARRRLGVVTEIVGIRHFQVVAKGEANHAGTTPMAMRKDAGAALIALAAWTAREFPRIGGVDAVWNIGAIAFEPGAANVVPHRGVLTLEFRDRSDDRLDTLERGLLDRIARWNAQSEVVLTARATARIAPAAMAPKLRDSLAAAVRALGEEPMFMASGAGHDAMYLARVIPSGMIFVPSIGGRSHDVSENTDEADIVLGCRALAEAIDRFIRVTETA